MLEDEADAAIAHGNVCRILFAEMDLAAIGKFEAGHHAQDGRLAGAGRAEQRHQFAALDVERDAMHGAEGFEGLDDRVEANVHEFISEVLPASVAGRLLRPAPWRSRKTLTTSVTSASVARIEAAAKAPTAL